MGVSRQGQFLPCQVAQACIVYVLLLGRRINVDRFLPPMTDRQAFKDIMVDLGTRGTVTSATIPIL